MLNIKGGVGKTVLAANLFAAAHLIDKRSVCFIDLDPQHNLTQYFLPPDERNRRRSQGGTIHSVFGGHQALSAADIEALLVPLNRGRQRPGVTFDLVAGDDHLFEFTLDIRKDQDKLIAGRRFAELVAALRTRYDVVVLDVNPCATFLTRCAISAATHIVAPVRPEKYSLTGLNMLEQITSFVRGREVSASEFSILLNGVGDRARARGGHDVDAETRAEIGGAPFFGAALLTHAIPYTGLLRATPADRYTANPINVTAMLRMAQRDLKESLTGAAAEIMRRASA